MVVCRWRFLPHCSRGYCSNSSRPATPRLTSACVLRSGAHHIQNRLDAVSLSRPERPTVGRHRLRKKTFRNESPLAETVRTDGRSTYVRARASVCVGADADVFGAHLRHVRGGHSLKAPPTDDVYAGIKASFRST